MTSVIVLEFNELTPRLMDRFIGEGRLPGFKRLRDQSLICTTDAAEEPPNLEPWIQWVSVHTGLSFDEHKVFDLDDGAKLAAPRVWDTVAEAGEPVWVCGSMNGALKAKGDNGLFLPDPWATGAEPEPETLFAPYLDLVRNYVREHTRGRAGVGLSHHLRFAWFMARHGLSARTVLAALGQLASELAGGRKWRRAAILDRLQWDVFRHFYRKGRPKFSTFFLNSTAHFQHYYWRNLEPEAFQVQPSATSQAEYGRSVLFGYQRMDEIVSEALEMASDDTMVVLCTALGQQPLLKYEAEGGMQLHRPRDVDALMRFAGVTGPYRVAMVMAEAFRLYFDDEPAAKDAEAKLEALRLTSGAKLMHVRREGAEICGNSAIISPQPADTGVVGAGSNVEMAFADAFYLVEDSLKSGMHHPHGLLWFRAPDRVQRLAKRFVSLQEIAPTLLRIMGLSRRTPFSHPPMAEVEEILAVPEVRAAA